MKRIGLSAILVVLLSGCIYGMWQGGLNTLVGKDIQTAFNVLGYPSAKQEFGSETVYTWSANSPGTYSVPRTSTTTGTIGTTPVYGTTTYYQDVPYTASCLIKIISAKNSRILSWEVQGNNLMPCSPWIDRLVDYYKQNGPRDSNEPEREFDNLIVPPGVSYAQFTETKNFCASIDDLLDCMIREGFKLGTPGRLPIEKLSVWRKNNFPNEPSVWTVE
jgi:hypothetical protein